MNRILGKINEIILILLKESNIEKEFPIWPPKSKATDYNGFSQAEIGKIIRAENLKDEIIKFQFLLGSNL